MGGGGGGGGTGKGEDMKTSDFGSFFSMSNVRPALLCSSGLNSVMIWSAAGRGRDRRVLPAQLRGFSGE